MLRKLRLGKKNVFSKKKMCISKTRLFRAITIPWFRYRCHSKRLLIPLFAKHQILLLKICTRNKLEHLIM